MLEDEQANMDDKQFSSHLSIWYLRLNHEEIFTSDDFTEPRMEHYRCKWRPSQDAVYWVNLARAQDEGLQFWQTRSDAIVVYCSVPPECIHKVISRNGVRVLFERLATRRPPPKVVLKSWQTQKQQQDTSGSASARRNFGEGRDTNIFQENQQRRQKPLATGNCCGVMCQTSLMLKKSLNLKSTSELKELLTM